jgi:hypothetical protein
MKTDTTPYWFYCSNGDTSEIIHGPMSAVKMHHDGGPWTLRSCGYPTKEALYEGEGILENCSECGVETFSTNWREPLKTNLITNHVCFDCQFWMDKLLIKDELGTVRAEGQHYQFDVNQPVSDSPWRGFGGRDFDIHFHDGRVVKTNNLWSQGVIPERWRIRLPDNAAFHWPAPVGHGQGFLG